MPPRFRDESITALNQALLRRVPECIYTPEDIAELQQSEGLDAAQIIIYAKNFRARTQNEDRALALTHGHENGPKVRGSKNGIPPSGKFLTDLALFKTLTGIIPYKNSTFFCHNVQCRTRFCTKI